MTRHTFVMYAFMARELLLQGAMDPATARAVRAAFRDLGVPRELGPREAAWLKARPEFMEHVLGELAKFDVGCHRQSRQLAIEALGYMRRYAKRRGGLPKPYVVV